MLVQVEFDPNSASNTVRRRLQLTVAQGTGPGGVGQRRQRQPMVRDHCRAHSRQSYRWYVNGKLYKQVLAPGLTPKPEEAGVTKVLVSPYTVPLDYLRWPIQFESKGTSQTNDVIVAIDHWAFGSLFDLSGLRHS
jgi:hypothetical protein